MPDRVRFDTPPVVEVLCGVLFGSLTGLRTAHVGIFWDRIKEEFPLVEEAPPLSPVIERFDPAPSFEIEVELSPPLARTWFYRADRRGLVQLQRDRFVYNWKRSSPDDGKYPSYDRVILDFERLWSEFRSFVASEGVGEIVPRQLELAYVNIIPDASIPAGDPVFVDHVPDRSRVRLLQAVDGFVWRSSYMLPDDAGRLHVSINSARQAETGEPVRRMDIVARGISMSEIGPNSMRSWFDLAHHWIVNGFVDATTASMQTAVWRRKS